MQVRPQLGQLGILVHFLCLVTDRSMQHVDEGTASGAKAAAPAMGAAMVAKVDDSNVGKTSCKESSSSSSGSSSRSSSSTSEATKKKRRRKKQVAEAQQRLRDKRKVGAKAKGKAKAKSKAQAKAVSSGQEPSWRAALLQGCTLDQPEHHIMMEISNIE